MRDGSDYENRKNRRNGNRDRGDGRLRASDVDSYRPGSKRYESMRRLRCGLPLTGYSPRESRYGRLRGRSASPVSGDDGDGRYGFTEAGTSTRRQYRSRSRSRNNRRRREPSVERWTHDRANYDREQGPPAGRWTKDTSAVCYSDRCPSYHPDSLLIEVNRRDMAMRFPVRASTVGQMHSMRLQTEEEDRSCHA